MQVNLRHVVSGTIALVLLLFGSFAAGSKWRADDTPESNTASAAASQESASTTEEAEIESESSAGTPLYDLVKVIDGDTITIKIDGENETIRLIGIDTPETNDSRVPVQCFGKEATAKLKSVIGTRVSIEKDAGEGERDKYRRLLAYVYTEEGTMLNKYLVAQGYAYEYTYKDPYKYQKEFKAAEADAKKNKRGLWAPNACPEPAKPKASTPVTQAASAAAAIVPAAVLPAPQPTSTVQTASSSGPVQEESKKVESQPKVEAKPNAEPESEPEVPASSSSYTCASNKYNCKDFKTQAEAQSVFEQCGGTDNDVHRLDSNKDGEVCESLP